VPIDDENCFVIGLTFHPTKAFTGEQRETMSTRAGVWTISPPYRAPRTSAAHGRWKVNLTIDNDFGLDRELQKTFIYSGLKEFWAQDAAPQLTMGRIYNRTKEHLGTSDTGIISMRRRLTEAVKKYAEDGLTPPEVQLPEVYRIRADALFLEVDESWYDKGVERRKVSLTNNPDSPN
jgi:hypothetical protein